DADLDNAALRAQLAQALPDYMVPAAFVRLDAFPLTPNGKLDRKALPAPDSDAYATRAYEPPQGRAERAIAAIWEELLQVERVGRHDNFFELGGHSLIAVTMIERMRRQDMHGDVRALFTTSSLAGFAAALREAQGPRSAPANMIPDGTQRIEPGMLPLVELNQAQIDAIVAQVEGGAANIQDIYPLAPLQEGILFHRMLAEHGDLYHATVLVRFADRARIDDFLATMQQVIDRHDILRTCFVSKGLNTPVQVVLRRTAIAHEALSLDPADGPIGEQLAARYAPGRFSLDVTRAPLLRFGDAFDPSTGQWLMCLVFHHLVLDHTSLEVIMEEATLIGQGRSDELLPPAPFRNYIWQVKVDADPAAHQAFFTRMLGDIDRPTAPFGLTQTSDDVVRFDEYTRMLPGDLSANLRRRARELGVSAASLMHLAWAMVLARATGQSSVVFGTVLFGRMGGGEDADRALGLFINTLPLRIDIDDADIVAAIKRTHAALAELLPHEHAPLVDAQRCSAVPSSMPLFTSLINYTYSSASASFRSDFHLEPTAGAERTNYPLAIAIDDQGENFEIAVQVLPVVGASRVWGYLQTALSGILSALDERSNSAVSAISAISAIEVMPAPEYARIVDDWNDTVRDFPLERCAHALFSEQVARDPQALALVFGGERIAYGELNARANRIAHRLRADGIGPGDLVAVALERGVEMVAALLGVLKAGGAYVPMATDAPSDRIAFMLDDAAPALLLAHRCAQLPERVSVPVLIMEEIASDLAQQPDSDPDLAGMRSSQPAYVIYTSGTTGTPKGVVVSHRNLVNFVYWCREAELIGPGHSMTQFAPYTFDASAGEIFGALLSGAELHLLDDATIQSPPQLQQYLLDHGVRFAALPPAYLQHMDPSRVPEGFRLLTAGSAPTPELVERWAGRGHYLNGYGPTETTILSTSTWLSADEETITIGKPIANTRLYLLDEQRRPVPIGVSGEIWIGGEGVTPGYLNRPELTDERYLDDPFDRRTGARMYRTGDLGRWMEDGAVEFLGRNDFQVKIRGFRIELGEIENRLCAFDGVREAIVLAREDGRGEKQLVAYYLSAEACDAAALRQHIGQTLPDYMMPAAFVWMQAWPLTANGKIDRKALPEPDDESYARRAYAAPESDIERSLAALWAELLRVDRVGRFDNFFDLGGHSLLAMQLVSRIRDALSIELPLRTLFEAPTLCDLAERLGGADAAHAETIPLLPRGQPLPLSLAQQRLWFLTRIEGASAAYHMGGAVRLRGALNASALARALQRIVDRHESLRTRFVAIDGQPMLEIASESKIDVAFSDLRGADDAEAQAQAAWMTLFEREYDLSVDLPLRAQLLRLGDDEHRLYLTMHHIVSDGWSIGVILRELGALYAAEIAGGADPLPPLTVQYADFAAWQRDWLDRGHAERLTAYWARTLGGAPTSLELPTDRPRPAVQDFAGDQLTLAIDADLTQRLRAISQRHGVTLYMTLLASWAALLCRLSNQDEVVIGTPMAGRNRAEIEPLVGFFVNT
ncbi:MAG: amino acid adenylation domain-containing protein, partial [Lysobacter sp.]|nr:amino acid adenylation domain-containing protein [Lysobacter sp.]